MLRSHKVMSWTWDQRPNGLVLLGRCRDHLTQSDDIIGTKGELVSSEFQVKRGFFFCCPLILASAIRLTKVVRRFTELILQHWGMEVHLIQPVVPATTVLKKNKKTKHVGMHHTCLHKQRPTDRLHPCSTQHNHDLWEEQTKTACCCT